MGTMVTCIQNDKKDEYKGQEINYILRLISIITPI